MVRWVHSIYPTAPHPTSKEGKRKARQQQGWSITVASVSQHRTSLSSTVRLLTTPAQMHTCKLKFFSSVLVSNAGILQVQLVKRNYSVHGSCLCIGFIVLFIERKKGWGKKREGEERHTREKWEEQEQREEERRKHQRF